jgi:hypothetical protein
MGGAGLHIAEKRDQNFKELVEETRWVLEILESLTSRVQDLCLGDAAFADYLATVSEHVLALSVKKLGPQRTREMLNQQLGEIKVVN